MKKIIFILTIFLFSSTALAALPTNEERLNTGGIIKSISIPANSDMATVNVEAVIDSPPVTVWAMLVDIGRWPKWLPMSRNAHFVSDAAAAKITPEVALDKTKVQEIDRADPPSGNSSHPAGHWVKMAYEEYDLPWPIQNEWVVRNYTYDETPEKMRASWKKVASLEDKDDGSWEISPREGGKTLLKYHYIVKVKEGVPPLVFKTAVNLTVGSMIKALRREATRISSKNT